MAAVSLEDMFQSEDVLADHHERASYDQYYAGFGRGFDRLQRPPEADRLVSDLAVFSFTWLCIQATVSTAIKVIGPVPENVPGSSTMIVRS